MKKFLSFLLAFAIMATTLLSSLPPLELKAATAASISSLKASPSKPYEGDSVQVTGTVRSGSYYLRAIQIDVRNEGDDGHGFTVDRVEFDFSDKKTSYSLSNLDEIDIGSYKCSGCGRTETLDVGDHRIDVHVGLYDSKGNVAEGFTKNIWIEVLEEEPPYVKDIKADINGTEVEFTVKTNLTAEYGILLNADGHDLDMIDWEQDVYSSYIKYTGTHRFNQTGERNITVYALDEYGDIVDGSEDYITIEIESLGQISAPEITTSNHQSIEAGNSFKVSWRKPTSPAGVTFNYNVYVWDGKNNVCVNSSAITGTSYTIPAKYFATAGSYSISVIAMAKDYQQSDDNKASIVLNVTEVKENPKLESVNGSVNGAVASFTVKGNADAKYGIVLYADGYELDMIEWDESGTSTIIYTGSHRFNQPGTRYIEVYPLDKNGNEVESGKATTTVEIVVLGTCDAPEITTKNNQTIEAGKDFVISWNPSVNPQGVEITYNVYVWDGKNNVCVNSSAITGTSYTIPAKYFATAGSYGISVIAMARDYQQSDDDDAAIKLNVTEEKENPDSKIVLTAPRVSGSNKIQYGDSYTVSWDYDEQVDFYQITIGGTSYKKTVEATEKSFTIPASVFKQYSGANTNYTISIVAMSYDTEHYLPSEAATITVNVAGYSESTAIIKSAEILDGNEIIGGTVVRFKVVTTKDVTALVMKDGVGSFVVNTWQASEIGTNNANAQYYEDIGEDRIWYVQQKVNRAGDMTAKGEKRLLTFYSMVGALEYNKCSVSFYCKKGENVIGSFAITSPSDNAILSSGKDLVINWSAPANTAVDYYIIDIYHGDVCVARATVTENSYTLSGALLERDNVAWQIHVTARKDEGQWAESVSTVSFKLECTHEHLAQTDENVLSYADLDDSAHNCIVEKTYSCLDCGLSNAKKEQTTVTKSHNWIALEKGGQVCNGCWHLESDPAFEIERNMRLSSAAGERAAVYFNVDANGDPINKQPDRYVFKTDDITILGAIGNCYLIEYPITVNARAGGATNCGFLFKNFVVDQANAPINGFESSKLNLIKEKTDEFFLYHKTHELGVGLISNEYSLARNIIQEMAPGSAGMRAFLMYLNKSQLDNIWDTFMNEFTDGDYETKKQTKAALYIILENISSDDLSESIIDKKSVKTLESLNEAVSYAYESVSFLDDLAKITLEDIKMRSPEFWNVLVSICSDIENIESNAKLSNAIKALQDKKEAFKDSKYWVMTFAETLLKMLQIAHIRTSVSQETLTAIEEAFQNQSFGNDEYIQAMSEAVQQVRGELDNIAFATVMEFAKQFLKNFGGKALDTISDKVLDKALSAMKIPSVFTAINIYDFIRAEIMDISGLGDYIKRSTESHYIGFIGTVLDICYLDYVQKYIDGQFTDEDYLKFYALHHVIQGVQISLNKCAIDFASHSQDYIGRLEQEIEHLETHTLLNWKYNPYAAGKISYPDLSWISGANNETLYRNLLDPSSKRSVILDAWSNKLLSEKITITKMVESLKKLSASPFVTMYIIRTTEYEKDNFTPTKHRVLLVNGSGEGLLLEFRAPTGWTVEQLSFVVLTKEQIAEMLDITKDQNKIPSTPRFSNIPIRSYNFDFDYSCIIGELTNLEVIDETLKISIDEQMVEIFAENCIVKSYNYESWFLKQIINSLEDKYKIWIIDKSLSSIGEKIENSVYSDYAKRTLVSKLIKDRLTVNNNIPDDHFNEYALGFLQIDATEDFPIQLVLANSGETADGRIWEKYYFVHLYYTSAERSYFLRVFDTVNCQDNLYLMYAKADDYVLGGKSDEIYRKVELNCYDGYYVLSCNSGWIGQILKNAKNSTGGNSDVKSEADPEQFLYWDASKNQILSSEEWKNQIHYQERYELNDDDSLPKSFAEALSSGFEKLPAGDAKYHQIYEGLDEYDQWACLKCVHPDGREAVYAIVKTGQTLKTVSADPNATKLLTLEQYPDVGPTFNYSPNDFVHLTWEAYVESGLIVIGGLDVYASLWLAEFAITKTSHNSIAHYYFDMLPYYWWNNVVKN